MGGTLGTKITIAAIAKVTEDGGGGCERIRYAPLAIQGAIIQDVQSMAPVKGFVHDLPSFLEKRDDTLLVAIDWDDSRTFPIFDSWDYIYGETEKKSIIQAIPKVAEGLEVTKFAAEDPIGITDKESQKEKERQQIPPEPPLQVLGTKTKESEVLQATVDDLHAAEDRENPQDLPPQAAVQIEGNKARELQSMMVGLAASGLSHPPQVERERLQVPPKPHVQPEKPPQVERERWQDPPNLYAQPEKWAIRTVGTDPQGELLVQTMEGGSRELQTIGAGRQEAEVPHPQPEKVRLQHGEEDKRQDSLDSPIQPEELATEKEVDSVQGLPAASTQHDEDQTWNPAQGLSVASAQHAVDQGQNPPPPNLVKGGQTTQSKIRKKKMKASRSHTDTRPVPEQQRPIQQTEVGKQKTHAIVVGLPAGATGC
ncbi:hypothetical protein CBR_g6729 [Chara braunii]|uniref:Uncharacterized protein n=1 Tax=Chara braunii TaxID=69332 RepID=A0A388KKX0_CHABU|nr:hypothetical protein CBR_g6729 [Chara braunii]|eukprot:GBG70603.1 hypothetical protein CBR_g6729 [Chara braunii]